MRLSEESPSNQVAVAALIGFATAATAIAVRHTNDSERVINAGGNPGGVPGAVAIEAALY